MRPYTSCAGLYPPLENHMFLHPTISMTKFSKSVRFSTRLLPEESSISTLSFTHCPCLSTRPFCQGD